MGHQPPSQAQLFYTGFNLDKRVRADHVLRQLAGRIDFEFSSAAVVEKYGVNGNVSVPPPIILKLMLLLVLYNVRSERELMSTLPERLDWLWFLGLDLDSEIPDHSVLSKARKRWGAELFKEFFERIVWQCVEAGLVDGSKIFVDSSLIDANAAKSSMVDRQSLRYQLDKRYPELERRLSEVEDSLPAGGREVNRRHMSATDPDAAVITRAGGSKLVYQAHRAVDPKAEVITATHVTRGDVHEGHRLISLLEDHQSNTERSAKTVVGDGHYGTIDNYLACHDRGVAAHLRELRQAALPRASAIYPDTMFQYDSATDSYVCPAGQRLTPKSCHPDRQSVDYAARKKTCDACPLRAQCTKAKRGRTIKRHLRQAELDTMRAQAASAVAKRDLKLRQSLMERSFARGTRFGFDRARWRGLWRVAIQEYLSAAIQNIEVLIRYARGPRRSAAAMTACRENGRGTLMIVARRLLLCLGPVSVGSSVVQFSTQ